MTLYYQPNGAETELSGGWTPVPPKAVGSYYVNIDDPQYIPPERTDYIQAQLFGQASIVFPFNFPAYFATPNYGDGTVASDWPTCQSVIVSLHAQTLLGTATGAILVYRGGVGIQEGSLTITTAWQEFSVTMLTDPLTGAAWSLNDLLTTSFGIYKSGNQNVNLARMSASVLEQECTGGARARLGPSAGEPSYFCAICSEPHHLSKLIKPRDPLHPQYERLVCSDCYDDITQYQTPEQGIQEGDFDFES